MQSRKASPLDIPSSRPLVHLFEHVVEGGNELTSGVLVGLDGIVDSFKKRRIPATHPSGAITSIAKGVNLLQNAGVRSLDRVNELRHRIREGRRPRQARMDAQIFELVRKVLGLDFANTRSVTGSLSRNNSFMAGARSVGRQR